MSSPIKEKIIESGETPQTITRSQRKQKSRSSDVAQSKLKEKEEPKSREIKAKKGSRRPELKKTEAVILPKLIQNPVVTAQEKEEKELQALLQQHPTLPKKTEASIQKFRTSLIENFKTAAKAVQLPDKFVLKDLDREKTMDKELSESQFQSDKSVRFTHSMENEDISASVTIQGKGYLHKGEFCADYASVSQLGNATFAIITDGAGNSLDSKDAAVKVANRVKELVLNDIKSHKGEISKEEIRDIFKSALTKAQFEILEDGKHRQATLAMALVLEDKDGRTFAICASVGDARIMIKKADGTVKDLDTQRYYKSYRDSGGSIGEETLDHVEVAIEELEDGDLLLLGSDGFGDNMEAKTLGYSPDEAMETLRKRDGISSKESLELRRAHYTLHPTGKKTKLNWDIPGKTEAEKSKGDILQSLHTRFAEAKLLELTKGCTDPAKAGEAVYKHCTQSDQIKLSLRLLDFESKLGSIREDIKKEVNSDPILKSLPPSRRDREIESRFQVELTHIAIDILIETTKCSMADALKMQEKWLKNFNDFVVWVRTGGNEAKPDDFSLIVLSKKSSKK